MTRAQWFSILQVAVIAPWLYSVSTKQKNNYFRVGLKLVAGTLIIMNLPPVLKTIQAGAATVAPEQAAILTPVIAEAEKLAV